jgi:hypothetical protein
MVPRLLQTVPSTMVYWLAVESTRRVLLRHAAAAADGDAEAEGEAASQGGVAPPPVQARAADALDLALCRCPGALLGAASSRFAAALPL